MLTNLGEIQWLVRQAGLILGPFTEHELREKLDSGDISPDCEVGEPGSDNFIPIEQLEDQAIHEAVAKARVRVTYDQRGEKLAEVQRKRALKIAIAIAIAVGIVASGVAIVGNYIAVHGASDNPDSSADITIDPPTVAKAKKTQTEDMLAYGAVKKNARNGRNATARGGTKVKGGPAGAPDPDGLDTGEVDEAGYTALVTKYRPALVPCIRAAVADIKTPARIPIEFTVNNDGRVSKVWIDNPEYRDNAPLTDCLTKELQKWPFAKGGAATSISLAFNVGPRK